MGFASFIGCSTLRMGGVRMRIDKRDGRCVVITIDLVTSERSNRILRTAVKERGGCLGVYGACVTPGRIELGDAILIEYDHQ